MQFKNNLITSVLLLIFMVGFTFSLAAYEEAPMLQKKVEEGELNSVEERLPEEPLVIEPWHETGEYGGTWNRITTYEDIADMRLAMYGFSLLRYDDNLEVVEGLAKDWEANADKTEWTIYLRKGLKWSDGAPFTVDDILFWWEDMATDGEHPQPVPRFMVNGGKSAEIIKIDDYTFKVKYVKPNPIFHYHLAMWTNGGLGAFIAAPKHYLKQFHPRYSDEVDNYEEIEEKQEWWRNNECPVLTAWKIEKYEAGGRSILERNPYYYAVDTEGNQLPYIDKVVIDYASDMEVIKTKLISGDIDMQVRPYVPLRECSLLMRNEEDGDYTTYMWESGSGSGPLIYPNWNHPDPEKREIYRKPQFRRALSHAIDRDRIKRMVFYEMGDKTIGTFSPKTPEYQTPEGSKVMEEWKNSYIEYDPEKAKAYLDEIKVTDQDDDGWRELPSGADLTLRVDMDAEAGAEYQDASQFKKEMWQEIGLKTIINTVDGSQLGVMQSNANFDIRDSWEWAGDHVYPHWLYPIGNGRWAPLFGAWKMAEGTEEENAELDQDPRDRTPPRKEPPAGGPVDRLQKLYDKIVVEPDLEKRNQLIYEATRIHIDEGPFVIGTVSEFPVPFIVKNNFKNVPTQEELGNNGLVFPWHIPHPAITNPCQYYIEQ